MELTHIAWNKDGKDHGAQTSTNKAFPRLIWRKLDQWRLAERLSKNEGHDVVDHDWSIGDYEPEEAFINVVREE